MEQRNMVLSAVNEKELPLTEEQIAIFCERKWLSNIVERLELYDTVKNDRSIKAEYPFESVEYLNMFKRFIMQECDREVGEHLIGTIIDRLCIEIKHNIKDKRDEARAHYLMDRFMELFRPFITDKKKREEKKKEQEKKE